MPDHYPRNLLLLNQLGNGPRTRDNNLSPLENNHENLICRRFWDLCTERISCTAQDSAKTFGWVRASDENVQLDPGDYFSGRVYRPGPDGGDMHVIIHSRLPVTVAMVPADQWNAADSIQNSQGEIEYRCMREHVTDTTYECHLPPRHMVLVMYDERRTDRAIFRGINVIIDKGVMRKFMSPNKAR